MEMTNKEKIEMLKDSIYQLYVNEGRSKSYISKLFNVDRKILSNILNYEYRWIQGKKHYLKPSTQKFINKNKKLIISRFLLGESIRTIANELKISPSSLRSIINLDSDLRKNLEEKERRRKLLSIERKNALREKSSRDYSFEVEADEEFKEILGYPKYKVSNYGKVIKYSKTYDAYYLIKPQINPLTGRVYIKLISDRKKAKNLILSRIVAHNFCVGFSEVNNTVNHVDGNLLNNNANNLEWISQSDNNKHSYRTLNRNVNRRKKYRKIILNDKYEFKTIRALAKFLGKSETQVQRYINGESKSKYNIKLIINCND